MKKEMREQYNEKRKQYENRNRFINKLFKCFGIILILLIHTIFFLYVIHELGHYIELKKENRVINEICFFGIDFEEESNILGNAWVEYDIRYNETKSTNPFHNVWDLNFTR